MQSIHRKGAVMQCACGARMLPIADKGVLCCLHCDSPCELTRCQRCNAFEIGSRHKKDANYYPKKFT